MTTTKTEAKVRSMALEDLDAIFFIDHQIRKSGKAITYANLTTEHIFTIDRHVGRLAKPISYVDLIHGDVSQLLRFGLVAEVEGHVRGFILGRLAHVGEAPAEVGEILILGVHPDYERRDVATALVNALCDKFRSEGIKKVRIEVDQRDKDLAGFVEKMDFGVGHRIDYSKKL
jgi:ribosomal protein S18 acetylase RimI-like enzyme